jgi:hypothetical protein
MFAQIRPQTEPGFQPNIVPIRLHVTQRHRLHLQRWLEAGRRMGLHDAEIVYETPDGPHPAGLVLIWVREAPDPAYRVLPDRMRWCVVDHRRDHVLGQFSGFEAALNFIRPVLTTAA